MLCSRLVDLFSKINSEKLIKRFSCWLSFRNFVDRIAREKESQSRLSILHVSLRLIYRIPSRVSHGFPIPRCNLCLSFLFCVCHAGGSSYSSWFCIRNWVVKMMRCVPLPINKFIDFDFHPHRKQFPFSVCIKLRNCFLLCWLSTGDSLEFHPHRVNM